MTSRSAHRHRLPCRRTANQCTAQNASWSTLPRERPTCPLLFCCSVHRTHRRVLRRENRSPPSTRDTRLYLVGGLCDPPPPAVIPCCTRPGLLGMQCLANSIFQTSRPRTHSLYRPSGRNGMIFSGVTRLPPHGILSMLPHHSCKHGMRRNSHDHGCRFR